MTKNNKSKLLVFNIILFLFILIPVSSANNLSITNVALTDRNPSSKTAVAQFDLSWDNSWKTKINHDAVWITVRLHDPAVNPTHKKLCQITDSGLNPVPSSAGDSVDLELYVPSDRTGAFVRLNNYAVGQSVSSTNVRIEIDYDSCGFTEDDSVYLSVFALEMVYIPEGAFYTGDYVTSTASLNEGSSDPDPWYIADESGFSTSNPTTDGYRYVSAGNALEDSTGTSFSVPNEFPKGYQSFYMMKYEITEGQWVEFLNSLPSVNARANHDITDTNHKNTDSVLLRNTVSCSGSPLTCSTQRPQRAMSFLTWMDLAAFLDWAALRPMSELEFEKAARGPVLPEEGEFVWGTTSIVAAGSISAGDEDGNESVTTLDANANYNNVTFSGGDAPNGIQYSIGPLRSGIFATGNSTRETAGASYYGVMELSGNLKERVVSVGNSVGRNFTAEHGDGVLSTLPGFEGNANETGWPGLDAQVDRGVTGATGSGFRGGSFSDQSSGNLLRTSDRTEAARSDSNSYDNSGGRGVRTYDGN